MKRAGTIKLDDVLLKHEKLEDLDPSKLSYNDIQRFIKELQKEYKELEASDLNPDILEGEPLKKIVNDIDKFKYLYE